MNYCRKQTHSGHSWLLDIDPKVGGFWFALPPCHYNDVMMSATTSQVTSVTIVYSRVYSSADQRKHQSSASLAFVKRIHRWPMNSPHKGPVTRKMFPFGDVIMHSPHFLAVCRALYYELTNFVFDECKNICTWFYHHQIRNVKISYSFELCHTNGMSCMFTMFFSECFIPNSVDG